VPAGGGGGGAKMVQGGEKIPGGSCLPPYFPRLMARG